MPALNELRTRRAILTGAASGALLAACGPGEKSSSPAPITPPNKNSAPSTPQARIELNPTPITSKLWDTNILREVSTDKGLLPVLESQPDALLENPSFIADGQKVFARTADGTIAELDPRTGKVSKSTGEQGALLGSTLDSVFFVRAGDLRVYKLDKATGKTTLLLEGPTESPPPGTQKLQNYYRYPAKFGSNFLAATARAPGFNGRLVTFVITVSYDGTQKDFVASPNNEELITVVGQEFLTYCETSTTAAGNPPLIELRTPGRQFPVREFVGTRPALNPEGTAFLTIGPGRAPYVYSIAEKKFIYAAESAFKFADGATVKPIFLNESYGVLEIRTSSGTHEYDVIDLSSGNVTRTPVSPSPSEFFGIGKTLYQSTPNRNLLTRAPGSKTENGSNWTQNNDVKAVNLIGQVQIGGKELLLFGNWKTNGIRKSLFELAPNEVSKIRAVDARTGENVWTFNAPQSLEESRTTIPYYPPQVLLDKNRLFMLGRSIYQIDLASGKEKQIGKDEYNDTSVRLAKAVDNVLYAQGMQKLFALKI